MEIQNIIIDIADLDVVFLTFNEPKKEEFWAQIHNMVPWAKRIDGVIGSDAAHKSAAAISETDRFIIVDGDNIPNEEFFNQQLTLDNTNSDKVFRWKARNTINGLQYGNGGISCWTKDFVNNMQTHENSDGSDSTSTEFCYDKDYWAMYDVFSTTYPNGSPEQAWRAGFREGVKMCLNRGTRLAPSDIDKIHPRNLNALSIWHNVGADSENGIWAMYGARMGTAMVMLDEYWNHTDVQDFAKLHILWRIVKDVDPISNAFLMGEKLQRILNLAIVEYDAEQSKFFKHHYVANYKNKGIMVRD